MKKVISYEIYISFTMVESPSAVSSESASEKFLLFELKGKD